MIPLWKEETKYNNSITKNVYQFKNVGSHWSYFLILYIMPFGWYWGVTLISNHQNNIFCQVHWWQINKKNTNFFILPIFTHFGPKGPKNPPIKKMLKGATAAPGRFLIYTFSAFKLCEEQNYRSPCKVPSGGYWTINLNFYTEQHRGFGIWNLRMCSLKICWASLWPSWTFFLNRVTSLRLWQ